MADQDGMTPSVDVSLPGRLYRDHRRRYIAGVFAWIAFAFFTVEVASVWAFGHYAAASTGEFLASAGIVTVALASGFAWSTWRILRDDRALVAWTRVGPVSDRAAETWGRAVSAPRRLIRMYIVGTMPLTLVAVVATLSALVDDSVTAVVVQILGTITAVFMAGALAHTGLSVAMRPVLDEVSAFLPSEFTPRSAPRLARRIRLDLVALVFLSGIVVAGISSDSGNGAGELLRVMLVSAVLALSVGWSIAGLLTARILAPVRALIRATRRIAAGDLTVRVPLLSDDEQGQLAKDFNEMVRGLEQRAALHSAMSAYVDPTVAERVLSEGQLLPGEAVEVTVMFVDIIGFTSLAEHALAGDLVSDLNDFFGVVIPVVEAHGGQANKLLGDGLMAVFGAPLALNDHADRALSAAREIDERLWERYDGRLRVGIGLNSGTVVAGSMGGGTKLDYTVIGDPVNVAARVEALTRETGDAILLTEATRQALSSPPPGLQIRGSTPVKGRSQEVATYAVPGRLSAAVSKPTL